MGYSRLLIDVKQLVGRSAIYGLGSVILRSISFFMLPLYTRYLTPTDYGIMAATTTITIVLSILYSLSLHGAVTPFYFNAQNEIQRRRNCGVIWVGIILVAISMAVLLDRLGDSFFLLLFQDVPFDPYLRLAIWTAFLNILGLVPLNLFQIQERPGAYVLISLVNTLLSMGLVVYLVVFQRQGAYGYLFGMFLASLLMAGPYLVLTLRQVQVDLDWNILKAALAFSLPLVPHSLASWILELSDRIILERYVPLSELGLYALGYQLGTVMTMLATAINNAWVPFLFKTEAEQGNAAKPSLARLATYYTLVLSWGALGLALLARNILLLMTPPAFHSAYQLIPWIIGGLLMSSLYFIPVNFLFLKSKTGWIPVVTVVSGLVNVGLNLWLVPSYGIIAAAWSTFLAYGLMLLLVWAIALRVYPFPYDYRRLGLIILVAIGMFGSGIYLQSESLIIDLGVKGLLLLVYPIILAVLGIFTPAEKAMALSLARQSLVGLNKIVNQ